MFFFTVPFPSLNKQFFSSACMCHFECWDKLFFFLHNFINIMSATNFSNLVFFCSKFLTTLIKSCPCFFLICFEILFQAYNLIIKSATRSLIIFQKLRKMTNDFFNNYIFVRTFQRAALEYLTNVTITVNV